MSWLTARPIAHRGLHDGNRTVFENSMAAFEAAVRNDYAIECDVHIARDGVPVVFHDHTLERMTGELGNVGERPSAELADLRLGSSSEGIPTLANLLRVVDGRVPIVIELKGSTPDKDDRFVERVAEVLDGYGGRIALMSFDYWLIEGATKLRDRFPLGLTAEGTRPEILEAHRAVFETQCDFVSYNIHHLPNPFITAVRDELRRPVISWTVRTPDDVERSRTYVDQMTFEGFKP